VTALPLTVENNTIELNPRGGSHTTDSSAKKRPISPNADLPPAKQAKASTVIKVPVQLARLSLGSETEHWVLVIEKTHGFHAVEPRNKPHEPGTFAFHDENKDDKQPLEPAELPYAAERADKLIDLGCEASFQNKEEMNEVFKELLQIKMTGKPSDSGSNCMDYVKMALQHLAPKHIPEVPPKFTKEYNDNYAKVREEVYHKSSGSKSGSGSGSESESGSGSGSGRGKPGSQGVKKGS